MASYFSQIVHTSITISDIIALRQTRMDEGFEISFPRCHHTFFAVAGNHFSHAQLVDIELLSQI